MVLFHGNGQRRSSSSFCGCGSSMCTVIYQQRPHPCNRVQRHVELGAVRFKSVGEYVKKMCSPNQALKLTEIALVNNNASTQT
jgi:hypothetical protein